MIVISHNMVHGALRTIIIHRKEYWNKRVRLTHRGPVNMDIVLYITYLNVYLRWDCFILFQVSPRYLKWSLYQHPICGSKHWPGTEQASCHYMKQRWPFWQMHMWVIWPQWVNELSALLKTEYQWRGEYARSGYLGAADLHIMNVVDADRRNNSHFDIPNRIYLLNDVLQQTQILPYYGCRCGLNFDL